MIESIKHFFNLLFDNKKSWSFRAAAGISIIGFLILTDLTLNFSYNLHINNKINQLEKIQNLKRDYQFDSIKLKKITILEKNIINKEHYFDFLLSNLSSISFKSSTKDKQVSNFTGSHPKKSLFWMVLSSNYLLIIIFPFLIFMPLYDRSKRTGSGILDWFASLVMIVIMGTFTTWVSYQIPIIWDKLIFNYILNALAHTLFWGLIIKLGKDKDL